MLRFSQARDLDPESTLVEAYPLLERLLSAGFLVAAGSDEAGGIGPSLLPGARVGGWEVLESVQILEDTEVYLARDEHGTFAALKIERAAGRAAAQLTREAAILAHLEGDLVPRLLEAGEREGRRFLALAWISGADALTAAGSGCAGVLAGAAGGGRSTGLLALGRSIVKPPTRASTRGGVIHGDVHPRNVLVAPGWRRHADRFRPVAASGNPWRSRTGRGGVLLRAGIRPRGPRLATASPAASAAAEQYALAGAPLPAARRPSDARLQARPRRDAAPGDRRGAAAALRRSGTPPPGPRPESSPWRAPSPSRRRRRFDSLEDFESALNAAADAAADAAAPRVRSGAAPVAEALLGRVLDRLGIDGPLFREGLPEPPRASVTYGAAGIACALLRVAAARDDAALLALADLWITQAAALPETGRSLPTAPSPAWCRRSSAGSRRTTPPPASTRCGR